MGKSKRWSQEENTYGPFTLLRLAVVRARTCWKPGNVTEAIPKEDIPFSQ
jgi:hypothetical protein